MKQFWEQLRPAERRWVAGIGCLVFVVLNYFFVWPRFSEWHATSKTVDDANKRMLTYQTELAKQSDFERGIKKFEGGDGGTAVPEQDQILSFATFYQGRALENGVQIQSESTRPPHTNEFFMDHQVTLDVVGDEKGMVGFLYSLGSSSSIMRVREMSLHAIEPNRYQLRASITIVASYQRKPNAKGAPATAATTAATRPAPTMPTRPPASAPEPTTTTHWSAPINRSNQPPPAPPGSPRGNPNSSTNKPGPLKH